MNEDELAAIEARIAEPKPLRTGDMLDLIAEVRRLQAAEAAAQASYDWFYNNNSDETADAQAEQAMCSAWYAWRKAKGE